MPEVKEILRKIKKLEVKTRKPVEELVAGNFRSVFKGSGIEFSEVREYVAGDDIRSIDWNVTARMNTPYVKSFIEERNLSIYIVFDVSGSGDFGFMKTKKEAGYEIAASIMFSALRNNDGVGLFLFSDGIEKFIPKRTGRRHMLKMLREMVYYEPKNRNTNLSKALTKINNIIKKKSIIFIISDFICEDFEKPLKHLKNRHDVVLIDLSDLREEEIPDIGYMMLEDEETGEQILVNTSDPEFRRNYSMRYRSRSMAFAEQIKKLHTDIVHIKTGEDLYKPLMRFLRMREKRIR